MPKQFYLEVWGDMARFTRPEFGAERVTYDVMTPSAARGILEAIYWKPQIKWVVDAIQVLNPIRFIVLRTNEIKNVISSDKPINVGDSRTQRFSINLRDVRYIISAHIEFIGGDEDSKLANPQKKHEEIFERRARKGQCFQTPYLGCREFMASWKLVDGFSSPDVELLGTRDLGSMFKDFDFHVDKCKNQKVTPHFFHARLNDGVLEGFK